MGMPVWKTGKYSEHDLNELIINKQIPRPIALTLLSRGVDEITYDSFISSQLKSLGDPYRLHGVEKAAARIWEAIANQENILIYGDYDTDGITAASVVYKVLSDNRANASCFLPHRFEDGYGFTVESLDKALAESAYDLIITVDCGITGYDTVESAIARGIDVIVTDHHDQHGDLPNALAVINPKIHDDTEDLTILAGVGVAFKLCHGFLKYGREHRLGGEGTDLKNILDLVALGTVADIVPLVGENRIMVKHGLSVLSTQVRPGIRALCESVKIGSKMQPSHISFNLAPKLNAAGRFGSPREAFDLLNTSNIVEAYSIAEDLNNYNILRKQTEAEIYSNALLQLKESRKHQNAILVAGENWHLGVIGIVASKLAREFNAPAIVLSIEGEVASGSGRSVENFNLIELLSDSSDLLLQYGGHPMAAGLSLKKKDLMGFFDNFAESIEKTGIQQYIPSFEIDGEVSLSELDQKFFSSLEKLEPFGCGNPEPLYKINNLVPSNVTSAALKHSKGRLRDSNNNSMSFIAFNIDTKSLPTASHWDIVATPQINSFRGENSFQLQIKDIRPSTGYCL
jgi:single-stranded-DNA-specific exonuclease